MVVLRDTPATAQMLHSAAVKLLDALQDDYALQWTSTLRSGCR